MHVRTTDLNEMAPLYVLVHAVNGKVRYQVLNRDFSETTYERPNILSETIYRSLFFASSC